MNEIEIFKNNKFGELRTCGTPDKPYFCLVDICRALEIKNVSDCKSRLNQHGVVITDTIDTLGRKQPTTFVNEGNLYKCIFQSRKEEAVEFQDWVTDEVLPSIRKTGSYSLGIPKTFAEALRLAADQQEKIEQQQKLIAEQKPKVDFFDTVAESKTAVSMNDAAKSLNFTNIGRNKLFDILRTQKILMNDNMPYQKYVDAGYFRVIEQKWTGKDGMPQISYKTLVYQKGIDYIRRMLENKGYSHKYKANEAQLSPSL